MSAFALTLIPSSPILERSTFSPVSPTRTRRRVANDNGFIDALPTELTLDMLEAVIAEDKKAKRAIALVCRRLLALVDRILYTSVTLSNSRSISLFARTARANTSTKPFDFLGRHVVGLTLDYGSRWKDFLTQPLAADVGAILHACATGTAMRRLEIDTNLLSIIPAQCISALPTPANITLNTFVEVPSHLSPLFSKMERLAISSPGDFWVAPYVMLESMGSAAHVILQELVLCRREGSNEINDLIFANDVRRMLAECVSLRKLTVKLVLAMEDEERTTASHVATLLRQIEIEDPRFQTAIAP